MSRSVPVSGVPALWLLTALVLAQPTSHAAAEHACAEPTIPVTRQLRQLYLDLLGRPPTTAEYQAHANDTRIDPVAVRALLDDEAFYERMKGYHRALLRSNVSASLPNDADARLQTSSDGQRPLETRGNASSALRGRNGVGCDHFIAQDDCKNPALQQDPHAEGPAASKICRDASGIPLPVSFDYDTNLYTCSALTGATSCSEAVDKGLLEAKYLLFCDMRRGSAGLSPFKCLPDRTKPTTAALTSETLDASGRVTAFVNPAPAAGIAFDKLERCTLALSPRNGVRGTYAAARGCIAREGWVEVDPPYWSTSAAKVAVCAIEAQTRAVNPITLRSCDVGNFLTDRACGCGERFHRCEAGDRSVQEARIASLNEEPLRIVDSVLRNDEDYFQILTTRRSFVNGVLSSLYRDDQATGVLTITPPVERAAVPALPYTAPSDAWTEYLRGEQAAGVLTTPGFLYRFPTQRARTAQFYEAFLCKTFVPPAGTVAPDPEDSCNRENDLQKRCGCATCHAVIEPVGAHWGRFGERSAQYLDPLRFPKLDPKCRDCALAGNTGCDGDCTQYVMQAYDGDGASSLGMLKSYLYRTSDDEQNISGGPRLLVTRALQSGDLQRCTVKRMWREFVGRPLSVQEATLYLDELAESFEASGHDLKQLIERIVTSDAYRRID